MHEHNYELMDLLNRCEALLVKVKPTAGYRALQLDGLYIEDRNDANYFICLGTFSDTEAVVFVEGAMRPSRGDPNVIEALDRIIRATVLDALADA